MLLELSAAFYHLVFLQQLVVLLFQARSLKANLSRCPLPPAEPSSRREEEEVEGEEAAEVPYQTQIDYPTDLFAMFDELCVFFFLNDVRL